MPELDDSMEVFDRQRARLARRDDESVSAAGRSPEQTDEQRARAAEMRSLKASRRLLDD